MRLPERIQAFFRRERSLQQHLVALYLPLLVLPLAVLGAVAYLVSMQSFEGYKISNDRMVMRQISASLDAQLKDMDRIALMLFSSREIQAIVKKEHFDTLAEKLRDADTIERFMRSLIFVREQVSGIVLLSLTSGRVFYNNYPHLYSYNSDVRLEEEPWYRQLAENDGNFTIVPSHWQHYLKYTREMVFSVARYIFDLDTFKPIGIVKVDSDVSTIEQIIGAGGAEGEHYAVVDAKGESVYVTGGFSEAARVLAEEPRDRGENGYSSAGRTLGGRRMLVSSFRSGYSGWTLVRATDYAAVMREASSFRTTYLIAILTTTLGCILISIFAARKIARPIRNLVQTMEEAASRRFVPFAGGSRLVELRQLIDGYNSMVAEVQQHMITEYRMKIAQKSAELYALQAQIKPHFLYNTLESIRYMAAASGDAKTADMICQLASLYRYSTKSDDLLVPLRAEVEYVGNYARLQAMRFRDRFDVEYEIDPRSTEVPIPKYTLQPLVENSISHGFRQLGRKGLIEIRTWLDGPTLTLEVKDDGVGIPGERLRQIAQEANNLDGDDREGSLGIGFPNVLRRLRSQFGDRFAFDIRSAPGEGTCIRFRIARAADAE